MRDLRVTPQFSQDLKNIPAKITERADALLFMLRSNPADRTLGVKKLRDIGLPAWRIRIGVYRLVYTFNQTELILLRFRHRKDVYRNF